MYSTAVADGFLAILSQKNSTKLCSLLTLKEQICSLQNTCDLLDFGLYRIINQKVDLWKTLTKKHSNFNDLKSKV